MELQSVTTRVSDFVPGEITDDEGNAMFPAVMNLFEKWNITDDEAALLFDLEIRTYRRLKASQPKRLDQDIKTRLSNLLGIHKALRIIFSLSDTTRIYAWIKTQNKAFGGKSALDIMLGGKLTDIMRVRRYLDAERGG